MHEEIRDWVMLEFGGKFSKIEQKLIRDYLERGLKVVGYLRKLDNENTDKYLEPDGEE